VTVLDANFAADGDGLSDIDKALFIPRNCKAVVRRIRIGPELPEVLRSATKCDFRPSLVVPAARALN
jgi:hypothetical protein